MNAETPFIKFINPVDLHVGGRVRMRRKFQGVSQSDLGDAIGLTFQQVQKYERGTNRVSASKLYEIAQTLHVSIAYFFDGYAADNYADDDRAPSKMVSDVEDAVHAFLMTTEGIELAGLFPRIRSAILRRRILELAKSLAADE